MAATAKEEATEVAQRTDELACKQFVELVADYLDDALSPELRARFEEHLAGCDGCSTYLGQTQRVMAELQDLSAAPDVNQQDPEIITRKIERHDA
jgi:anti-sigma factor RsiW